MSQPHRLRVSRNRLVLWQCLVHFAELFEVVVFEGLPRGHPVAIVVDEEFCDDLLGIGRNVWNQLCNARAILVSEIELHVRSDSLELRQKFGARRPQNVMNFVNLVKLVVSGEQGKQGKDLKVHAANAPIIHLVIVVAVGEQALGWAVPSRANILGEGRL